MVYQGFPLPVACKWVTFPRAATTFTYDFGGKWTGLPWGEVAKAWKGLLEWGVVVPVGTR